MTIEAQLDRIIALLEAGQKTAAPKAEKKAAKPAPAAVVNAEVHVPAESLSSSAPDAGAAQPVEQTPVAATLDDVRNALVKAQTRLGAKAKPQEVLAKYSKTGTTGGLDKADYIKVIEECVKLI